MLLFGNQKWYLIWTTRYIEKTIAKYRYCAKFIWNSLCDLKFIINLSADVKAFNGARPSALLWRHNGGDGIPNHQPHDCLFLFTLVIFTLNVISYYNRSYYGEILATIGCLLWVGLSQCRFILGKGSANERRRYIVTPPLIGWAHNQIDQYVQKYCRRFSSWEGRLPQRYSQKTPNSLLLWTRTTVCFVCFFCVSNSDLYFSLVSVLFNILISCYTLRCVTLRSDDTVWRIAYRYNKHVKILWINKLLDKLLKQSLRYNLRLVFKRK